MHALSDVLDQLEKSAQDESVAVENAVEQLGRKSFASLMLIFSLISFSPASAIPGITTIVAAIVFILVAQMIIGRDSVWLRGFIAHRRMSTEKLVWAGQARASGAWCPGHACDRRARAPEASPHQRAAGANLPRWRYSDARAGEAPADAGGAGAEELSRGRGWLGSRWGFGTGCGDGPTCRGRYSFYLASTC